MSFLFDYLFKASALELVGLVFGLANVILLIRKNIWNWPAGLVYVIASIILFWKIKLYADFGVHLVYLVLNIYGWFFWLKGNQNENKELPVTSLSFSQNAVYLIFTVAGTVLLGVLLSNFTDASLPYWDSTTSAFSITGIWLTARKKIESWYYWFLVDVLGTGIYFYKQIPFYGMLYLIYIGLAVAGYLSWRKSLVYG